MLFPNIVIVLHNKKVESMVALQHVVYIQPARDDGAATGSEIHFATGATIKVDELPDLVHKIIDETLERQLNKERAMGLRGLAGGG